VSIGPDLLGDRRDVRLNDGAVDPQGRFVVGTLALGEETGAEVLLRVSADGTVETLRDGIRLSNGVAFSPDGQTIYHVDTLASTVSKHSYTDGVFDHEEPWTTVLNDLPHYPDGLTVSADGSLWIAQWGGGCVRRHAPTGELLDVVMVDASQVSCPSFVGDELNILAITTAQEGLDTWSDQSGALFLADVGAVGLPAHPWRGDTTTPYWHQQKEAHA
jgi:sugar lactone lactonase YvrE